MNISIILNNIQDPRRNHLQKHSLETIIYITLAAVIGGAESWYEIEEFGNTHIDFFKSKIEGLEEIPSHDTFNRVFSIIKPKEFESGFRQWVQELYGTYKGIIAIDGKEMRGAKSEDENGKICPIRMVSAWAVDNGVSLGQEKVGEKSNEIKAIPKLLKILDLEGCIVTIDAIGCQHEIVKEVIENKGDYLIAVKENQQKLHKSLKREGMVTILLQDTSIAHKKIMDMDERKREYVGLSRIKATQKRLSIGRAFVLLFA